MNAIQQLAGQHIIWRQPSLMQTEYELKDAEHVQSLGDLNWLSWAHNRAIATVDGRTYYIDRPTIMKAEVEMRLGDSAKGELFGTFKRRWNNTGTFTTADGRLYLWKYANFFGSEWKWTTADDGEIMHFRTTSLKAHMTGHRYTVELSGAASDFPDAAPLVVLGFYLVLLLQRDAAAASS